MSDVVKDIMSKINELEKMNELDMSEFVNKYIKEEEEKRWKNEDRFNNFLDYLLNYIDVNKRVLSDNFCYEEEKCQPYDYREFEDYLYSLYDIVNEYASKNFVYDRFDLSEEDIYSDKSYCVKIKDKFYRIELVVGQGSYIVFELTENKDDISYVDYDLMINDKKSPRFEQNLKEVIHCQLEQLVEVLVNDGADKNLVEKFIREYKK